MEPNIEIVATCKYCHLPISREDFFCPSCGKKIKDKPVSLSIFAILWLMILSTLAPPFGIFLTFKYIIAEDDQAKVVGWISLVITIMALVATILLSKALFDNLSQQINSQMQNYSF